MNPANRSYHPIHLGQNQKTLPQPLPQIMKPQKDQSEPFSHVDSQERVYFEQGCCRFTIVLIKERWVSGRRSTENLT